MGHKPKKYKPKPQPPPPKPKVQQTVITTEDRTMAGEGTDEAMRKRRLLSSRGNSSSNVSGNSSSGTGGKRKLLG